MKAANNSTVVPLTGEYQADSGAVVTSGMSITPEVQYTYTSPTTGSLPSELIYPNGRIESFGYSNNALDAAIGRADAIINGVMHEANYTFQGLDTVITEETGDFVTLTNTLDQFGRIDEVEWVKNSNSAVLDDFQYGYDQDSNVLYEVNGVNANFSQLFSYDDLNRLTNFGLGALNAGHTAISTVNTTPSTYSQAFTLDAVGNQTAVATNGGSAVSNTEDSKNELNDLGSNTLAYDDDGNTTTDAGGDTLTYDAWNRMVSDSLGSTSYGFDANGQRIIEKHGGTTTDLYFTTQGQDIEERQSGTVINQYVWGLDYVNDLILRDDNRTSGNLGKSGSGLGRRLYVQHDANFNITSILSQTGMEYERMTYTPYGTVTVLNASTWAATSDAYSWLYYFQGGRMDTDTGFLRFGARDYNPMTGTWMEEDPDGYVAGTDEYVAFGDAPPCLADPTGLSPTTSQAFGPWFNWLTNNGMNAEFQGMWGDLQSPGKTTLSANGGGAKDLQVYSSNTWSAGGGIALDPHYVKGGVYVSNGGPNAAADGMEAAALSHELWHAFFDQKVKKCPKMLAYFKTAAKWYGNGVNLGTTITGKTKKISDDQRLVVLDEAVGVTIQNYVQNTYLASLAKNPALAQKDPRSAGYLSGEGLSETDKYDNFVLSKENWTVVRYLLKYGCKCSVDPQKILATPEADWGTL